MPEPSTPASVADEFAVDVRSGFDTDRDQRPDTVLTEHLGELRIHTDLDGDGFADQVLGIGPDAAVRELAREPTVPAPADVEITFWEP